MSVKYILPMTIVVKQNILNAGAYAQMQTKLFPGFKLTAGLRLDNATYFNKGTFNQTVYDELGLRTDNGLSSFQYSHASSLHGISMTNIKTLFVPELVYLLPTSTIMP